MKYLFLEIFDEVICEYCSCIVLGVFFLYINSFGLLFFEELKIIIFGFKNGLFLLELYRDILVFNLK